MGLWRCSSGGIATESFLNFKFLLWKTLLNGRTPKGLKTGRVISKRDIDTPLINEDEFVFKLDPSIDDDRVSLARELVSNVDESQLPEEARDFLLMKLGQ